MRVEAGSRSREINPAQLHRRELNRKTLIKTGRIVDPVMAVPRQAR